MGSAAPIGTGLALVTRLGPVDAVVAAALCVAGVALGNIDLRFACAWRLATWTFVLRGRCNTYGTGLALVTRLGPVDAVVAAALCVAGVALGDIDLRFACIGVALGHILHGRRGTYGTRLALVTRWVQWTPWSPRHFAWQAWHLATSTFDLLGRRGAWRHQP